MPLTLTHSLWLDPVSPSRSVEMLGGRCSLGVDGMPRLARLLGLVLDPVTFDAPVFDCKQHNGPHKKTLMQQRQRATA